MCQLSYGVQSVKRRRGKDGIMNGATNGLLNESVVREPVSRDVGSDVMRQGKELRKFGKHWPVSR